MTPIQEIILSINKVKHKGDTLTNENILEILNATRSITKHKQLIDSLLFFHTTFKPIINGNANKLTNREKQILYLIGIGKRSNTIATELILSLSTVETHRKNIIKKLGLVGRGKLVEYAVLYNLQNNSNPLNDDK